MNGGRALILAVGCALAGCAAMGACSLNPQPFPPVNGGVEGAPAPADASTVSFGEGGGPEVRVAVDAAADGAAGMLPPPPTLSGPSEDADAGATDATDAATMAPTTAVDASDGSPE